MNEPRPARWEEWQLTAFVLGELDADTAERIKSVADSDGHLKQQLKELKQTLDQVKLVLQAEARAETAELAQPAVPQLIPPPVISRHNTPEPRHQRWKLIGLLAMAASLLIAMLYGGSLFLTQPHLASSTPAQSPSTVNSEFLSETAIESSDPQHSTARMDKLTTEQLSQQHSDFDSQLSAHAADSPEPFAGDSPLVSKDLYSDSKNSAPIPSESLSTSPIPAGTASGPSAGYGGGSGGGMMGGGYGGEGGMGLGMGGYGGMGAGYGGNAGSMGGGMGLDVYGGSGYGIETTPGRADAGAYGFGGAPMPMAPLPLRKRLTPGIIIQEEEVARLNEELASSGRGAGDAFDREPDHPMALARSRPAFNDRYGTAERYESLVENEFKPVEQNPLSTFSIDVDTASYAKCRQLLLENSRRPPPGAVRIEEFINYFDYEYAGPMDDKPFASHLAVATCPWQPQHKLVRIALQAKRVDMAQRPAANVVFLLDVSGSMNEPNKLPLVKEAMQMLAQQLGENDKVAMAVYAGAAGCVLEGTRGNQQQQILAAINKLEAGGSTNGGQGIQLAYQLARDNFIPGGINRVVLCTDGDFNVGVTSTEDLVNLVAENAKSNIFLTVLGFGEGNTNDAMMEQISNRGNGVYGFVDSRREAHRQMVRQLAGNLMTVAKDVKIQVEFNPAQVKSYRLIGYENRLLAKEDFNDDRKDAGEIGAGHRVTALYEIVPVGSVARPTGEAGEELRYQPKPLVNAQNEPAAEIDSAPADKVADELLAVKLRYKESEGSISQLLTFPLVSSEQDFGQADRDFQWAATVAQFGMLLRGSRHAGQSNWSSLLEQATRVAGVEPDATRQECLEMIRKCQP